MEISEIKDGTFFYDVHALVKTKNVNVARNGRTYADIVLSSNNSSLTCKKWNYDADKYDAILTVGAVVKVSGKGESYLGSLQANLDTIEVSDKSPNCFMRVSQFDINTLYDEIMKVILTFEEALPSHIAFQLLRKYHFQFCKSPAAKFVHHAWVGGLVEHTNSMLKIALSIIPHYQRYGDYFSRDKVLFGIIVHDFAKIFEYDLEKSTIEMSPSGVLVNHIITGSLLVHNLAMEWWENNMGVIPYETFERERDHLMHLVASHHGTQEFGSPVSPASLEAVLLHHIDMLDSKFISALEVVRGASGDIEGFSRRINKCQYLQK